MMNSQKNKTKKLAKKVSPSQKLVKVKTSSLNNNYLSVYRAALSDPFSTLAQGARVPDMYSVPTATRHLTRKLTLTSNASGECDLVILPSAYIHAFSARGSIVGGTTLVTGDGASNTQAVIFTNIPALAAQLTNYRIVGYGVKVVGIASMTTNAGSLTIATVPAEGFINNQVATVGGQASNTNNAAMTVANTLTSWGIPNASGVVSVGALVDLPNTVESSMVNVSERPITVTPKICSPTAFQFKMASDIGPGYNIQSQTSLAVVSAGNASYLSFGGLETVVIAATGLPNSTSVLDIEITYHLEGIPFIAATSNNQIGSDAASVVCDPVGWMNIIKDVASLPTFKAFSVGLGNSFFPGLGTMVGKFLG